MHSTSLCSSRRRKGRGDTGAGSIMVRDHALKCHFVNLPCPMADAVALMVASIFVDKLQRVKNRLINVGGILKVCTVFDTLSSSSSEAHESKLSSVKRSKEVNSAVTTECPNHRGMFVLWLPKTRRSSFRSHNESRTCTAGRQKLLGEERFSKGTGPPTNPKICAGETNDGRKGMKKIEVPNLMVMIRAHCHN